MNDDWQIIPPPPEPRIWLDRALLLTYRVAPQINSCSSMQLQIVTLGRKFRYVPQPADSIPHDELVAVLNWARASA